MTQIPKLYEPSLAHRHSADPDGWLVYARYDLDPISQLLTTKVDAIRWICWEIWPDMLQQDYTWYDEKGIEVSLNEIVEDILDGTLYDDEIIHLWDRALDNQILPEVYSDSRAFWIFPVRFHVMLKTMPRFTCSHCAAALPAEADNWERGLICDDCVEYSPA